MDKLHAKMLGNPNVFMLEWVYNLVVHLWHIRNLRHLLLDHTNSKVRSINRYKRAKVRQKMFTGTNMVKVSVRKEDCFYLVTVVIEPLTIWHHIVNARIIRIGKKCTHINQDNFTLILKGSHILTNTKFAQAANWNDTHSIFMWASRTNLAHCNLLTLVAVVTRFVNWNTNNMLSSLSVHILA